MSDGEDVSGEPISNPDVIECVDCGGDIYHDEHLFYVSRGFNCHGSAMADPDSHTVVICKDCAPDQISPSRRPRR